MPFCDDTIYTKIGTRVAMKIAAINSKNEHNKNYNSISCNKLIPHAICYKFIH